MPLLNDATIEQFKGTGHYGFSATRLEELGATEYTLVGITRDRSGSVQGYEQELDAVMEEVVGSCKHSPRADNLMIRLVDFDDKLEEVHGFKLLGNIQPGDYKGTCKPRGWTALFDATENMVDSMKIYGQTLRSQDYAVNGIIFVLTDGMENTSKVGIETVKRAFKDVTKGEYLESLVTVLIGVNVDPNSDTNSYLEKFHKDAGFTQYVSIKSATKKELAKLAQFVSHSISSQSQALGSGGGSNQISLTI